MSNYGSSVSAGSAAACLAIVLALEYANPAGATLALRDAAVPLTFQQVNRTAKGDRLPVAAERDKTPKQETINVPVRILVGCDGAFSNLASGAPANFATRCLS